MNDESKTPNAQNDRRTIPQTANNPPAQTPAQVTSQNPAAQRPAQVTSQNPAAQRPAQATSQNPATQRPAQAVSQNPAAQNSTVQRPAQAVSQNPATQRPAQAVSQNSAAQRPAQAVSQNPAAQRPANNPAAQSRTIPQRTPQHNVVRRQTSFRPAAPNDQRKPEANDDDVRIFSDESSPRRTPAAPVREEVSAPTVKTVKTESIARKKKKSDHTAGEILREEGAGAVMSLVKAAIYLVVVLVVASLISMAVILVGNDMFAFVKESRDVQIVVPVGTDLDGLKDILAEAGLIKYPSIFKLYADHKTKDNQNFATLEFVPEDYEMPEGKSAAFIAGTYDLNTDMDYEDLLWSFLPPEKSGTSWVTIPEGFTTDDIINLLVEKGIGERDEYVEVINTYDFSSFWFVDELEKSGKWSVDEYKRTGKVSSGRIYRLDGYLFPDTYEFYNASREETVIKKMLYRFSQIYGSEYREMADAQGFSTDELITLSSMIEKEAGRPNDFFSVSEVFRNRLDSPDYFPYLQSDATVLYQISHEKGERPKHVTHEDTLLEVAYNTYANPGLPPGPISNPSATAILAALNPSKNGYYYFVSGPEETHFSTNQWDHNYWVGVTSAEWAAAEG